MRKSEATPVTAKDIGNKLGLSQPTVSRILSGAHGYRISPETRRRVLEAAAEMGYRPNAVARSLRRRRTNIVGFYTSYGGLDAGNTFIAETLGGLQWAANAYRLDILLHGSFRGSSTEDIYGELIDGRIDGLFVHTDAEDPLIGRLRESSLPVVAIADSIAGIPSVGCDDAQGVRLLLEYLWSKGHRRIGYIRPTPRFTSVEARCGAFYQIMTEQGANSETAPVFTIDLEDARPALEALLAMPEPPTAVCCWNDLTALNLISVCQKRGMRVPEDLAVVGFDGMLDPNRTLRPLVTIGANWRSITSCAMQLLVQQIENRIRAKDGEGEEETVPLITRLSVSLIQGDTA